MNEVSLSRVVVSQEGDRLYSFEYAGRVTETSVTLVENFIEMGLIEARGSMLRSRDIGRISQIHRLGRDLGLNLVAVAMVLDMAQEIAQLKAQLRAHQSQHL